LNRKEIKEVQYL